MLLCLLKIKSLQMGQQISPKNDSANVSRIRVDVSIEYCTKKIEKKIQVRNSAYLPILNMLLFLIFFFFFFKKDIDLVNY